ncbi:hypothetical protein ES703_47310 [subsurface metagenome]
MNLIKWLEENSDMKLGKLKTEIKKSDIIVVKGPQNMMNKHVFRERLRRIFPDNLVILLGEGMNLEKLSEREMNKAGWIRGASGYL